MLNYQGTLWCHQTFQDFPAMDRWFSHRLGVEDDRHQMSFSVPGESDDSDETPGMGVLGVFPKPWEMGVDGSYMVHIWLMLVNVGSYMVNDG
jgi:hypothetical protein